MSKRDLSRYLESLSKKELEDQVHELYKRLKEVREFYNFVFNPKEDKLIDEIKFKINKEYFPPVGRKPKKRRSTAQKAIRNFIKLGVDSEKIADVMLYNIETAQRFCEVKPVNQISFYKSILNSFDEAALFIKEHHLPDKFKTRLEQIVTDAENQHWENASAFDYSFDSSFKH
ncbi:MAG: hypothetical protein IPM74_08155 [Crocinitomicaceae bacterium]|nr:hypothetical protein [Crocinitomicaceae bacterium]MBK8925870.1 hypothetical protein [Crocinitomicaceae bacterium]